MELQPSSNPSSISLMVQILCPKGISSLNAPDQEAMVIDSLTLEQYHNICSWNLSQTQTITISTNVTVNLGAVFTCSPEDQLQDWMEIVFLPDVETHWIGWNGAEGEVMDNSWIR
jgi:hypothetical protein